MVRVVYHSNKMKQDDAHGAGQSPYDQEIHLSNVNQIKFHEVPAHLKRLVHRKIHMSINF